MRPLQAKSRNSGHLKEKKKYYENQTTTAPMTKNTNTGTNHDETKSTRSTTKQDQNVPNQAQNMPIQAQSMPIQAQNTPNQARNTIRNTTKNSPKIHTQSRHTEFWATAKNGRVRLVDLHLTSAFQNEIVFGGKHKNLPDE